MAETENLVQKEEPGTTETNSDPRKKEIARKWEEIARSSPSLLPGQQRMFNSYNEEITQYVVAGIILANFCIQCWKRAFDPVCAWPDVKLEHGEICENAKIWNFFQWFFNITFLLELLWNAYGSWKVPFFIDRWNQFDMVVVGLGVLDMLGVQMGNLKLLRMLRAFRIFRLFGRVESLRKVLGSLGNAFAGVSNAFLIVVIMMCIYAVLAVDLFGNVMCPSEDFPDVGFHGVQCFGRGYYGDFGTSLYTMFQILTGESWSEGCVWPLLDYWHDEPIPRLGVSCFFMSYILITQFVLLNVVVAVLLDGMGQVEKVTDTSEETTISLLLTKIENAHTEQQADIAKLRKAVETMPERQ